MSRSRPFLDAEAEAIMDSLDLPFADDQSLWFHFLWRMENMPGGGCIFVIYLEENSPYKTQHYFHGSGNYPSDTIKDAWGKIPKDWLEAGLKRGKEELDIIEKQKSNPTI